MITASAIRDEAERVRGLLRAGDRSLADAGAVRGEACTRAEAGGLVVPKAMIDQLEGWAAVVDAALRRLRSGG